MAQKPGRPGEYRPIQPNRPLDGPVPSAYNTNPPPRRRRGLGWLGGCNLFLLGIIVGAVGLGVGAVFFLGATITSGGPLPSINPSSPPGTPDISTDLSQGYINAELHRSIQAKPVDLIGLATLTDLVLEIRDNSQIYAQASVKSSVAEFKVGITEQISVQNNLIIVRSVGNPQFGNATIPVNINDIINAINANLVQPQINKYLTNTTVNGRSLKLIGLSTIPGIITAKFNVQ